MASIDDVYRNTDMLLDALIRAEPAGMTGGMGQVGTFPGLVPQTYRATQKASSASTEILTTVKDTLALLNAVNVETLGRIEAECKSNQETLARVEAALIDARANNDKRLGLIESSLEDVEKFLPTVREDLTALQAKLDTAVAELQQK